MRAIVTIRLQRNPLHDPHNKKTGPCPVSEHCTDCTGEHHSYLAAGFSKESITRAAIKKHKHVTRVEVI